jgi:hypothetical protein
MKTLFVLFLCAVVTTSACAQAFTAQELGDSVEGETGFATPQPASAPARSPKGSVKPKTVITIFEQACVRTEGQSSNAVDWALAHEFIPVDPETRGSMETTLLNGQPGTVLVAPKTGGRVMLAVAFNQCAVWAERTPGPPIRSALTAMVQGQQNKGATTQRLVDRSVERAGSWRNQMKWRYRPAGADQDWSLGVVTTMANSPGTQVLHWAPLAYKRAARAAN